jgi:hypothetical protein
MASRATLTAILVAAGGIAHGEKSGCAVLVSSEIVTNLVSTLAVVLAAMGANEDTLEAVIMVLRAELEEQAMARRGAKGIERESELEATRRLTA